MPQGSGQDGKGLKIGLVSLRRNTVRKEKQIGTFFFLPLPSLSALFFEPWKGT